MRYDNLNIMAYAIRKYTEYTLSTPDSVLNGFPILCIDVDSYIVNATIQSGIDLDPVAERHCLAIGKACSLADSITFLIDLNHSFHSVVQGVPAFLQGTNVDYFTKRKGTIILQNDVWVGHGATIMGGVMLHNGCVVAADAVVTKDVPPYAIVGGNPAKVIGYRFDSNTIAGLQKIAWWDWPLWLQVERKNDFALPASVFVDKYLQEATNETEEEYILTANPEKTTVLFIPDVASEFPLYPKILEQYLEKERPDTEMLIYMSKEDSNSENIHKIESILQAYEELDNFITLQTGVTLDERILFQYTDAYVTTRGRMTVLRTCLADRYGVRIFYGTDSPVFPSGPGFL